MRISILIISASLLFSIYISAQPPIQNSNKLIDDFERAQKHSLHNSDSAITLYKSIVNSSLNENDTLVLFSCIQIFKIQGLNQNFADAFEYAGQALRIAENLNDSVYIAEICGELGGLYKLFGKENESKMYLIRSMELYRNLFKNGIVTKDYLSRAHFNMGMHYREFLKYDLALSHLDTCELFSDTNSIYSSYHKAEQAAIYISMGDTKQAVYMLENIANRIEGRINDSTLYIGIKGFLTIIYAYLGDAYLKNKDYSKALYYFNESLINNEEFGFHNGNKSRTLEKLAISNYHLNYHKEAFLDLQESKKIADIYWDASSKKNSTFIEISNKYQEKIEKQRLELLEQDKLLAQQKQRILLFRVFIIALVSVLIISLLLIRNRVQKKNFNREKDILEEKRKNARMELELKNKELTAYTLKFIEKEKVISEISDILKDKAKGDSVTLSKLKTLNVNSGVLWEEFNSRFVEVNEGFYDRLYKRFPKLSPTERKHCALIKLKFSGKEMSHLLRITEHSVHVSRHRLRKKMNLEQSESLNEFISKI